MEQYMPFIWLGIGLLMGILEATTAQLVSIWFMFGAIGAAVTCVFTGNIAIQLAVFVVISLAALIATRPLVKRFKERNKTEYTNVDMNIGKTVRVLTEINNDKGTGEIKIGDTIWMARTVDGSVIPPGEPVIIQAVEGVKMMVVPQKTAVAK